MLKRSGLSQIRLASSIDNPCSDETDDEDLLESYSINVETGEFEKSFGKEKSRKRQYIFVTEDGKTAECIDDLGKE